MARSTPPQGRPRGTVPIASTSSEAKPASPERRPSLKFVLPPVVSLYRPEEKVTKSVDPAEVDTPSPVRGKGRKGSNGRSKDEKGESKNKKGEVVAPLALDDKRSTYASGLKSPSPPERVVHLSPARIASRSDPRRERHLAMF